VSGKTRLRYPAGTGRGCCAPICGDATCGSSGVAGLICGGADWGTGGSWPGEDVGGDWDTGGSGPGEAVGARVFVCAANSYEQKPSRIVSVDTSQFFACLPRVSRG
jgi:hypothetical protein